MPEIETPKTALAFVVMQLGGASNEWYAHGFDSLEEAEGAIVDIKKHTYDATDPFSVPVRLAEALRLVEGAEGEFYELLEDISVAVSMREFSELEPDEDKDEEGEGNDDE